MIFTTVSCRKYCLHQYCSRSPVPCCHRLFAPHRLKPQETTVLTGLSFHSKAAWPTGLPPQLRLFPSLFGLLLLVGDDSFVGVSMLLVLMLRRDPLILFHSKTALYACPQALSLPPRLCPWLSLMCDSLVGVSMLLVLMLRRDPVILFHSKNALHACLPALSLPHRLCLWLSLMRVLAAKLLLKHCVMASG